MKRKSTQDHEARPRHDPFVQSTTRLRKSLAELGEPGSSRDPSDIIQLAESISNTEPEAWDPILEIIGALVVEQPHKVPLVALVLELVNKKRSAIAEAAVQRAHSQLQTAINDSDLYRIKSWLRFICSLTVGSKQNISSILEKLLEHGAFQIVVIALVYLKFSEDEVDTTCLEEKLSEFCSKYTPAEDISLPIFGLDAPYVPKLELEHYVAAVKDSLQNGWDIRFMPKWNAFEDRDATPKHKFDDITFPEEFKLVIPDYVYTRVYVPQDGIESTPDPNTLFGLVTRDVATDIICNMDFNRKEVTRQLITLDLSFNEDFFAPPATPFDTLESIKLDGGPTVKVEEIAVEAILAQMMRLPTAEFPLVYYHSIMIEACIMSPAATAPVLGRAVRFLFANAATLDVDIFWRVVGWWAHHMSNFSFTWKWHEWEQYLELPNNHPQYVFMQQLVVKQVQLSYPARVRESLPADFHKLVPTIPEVPEFKYLKDEDVKQLLDDLERSSSEIREVLDGFKKKLNENNLGKEAAHVTQEYGTIVFTALCELGNRSITHATKWIDRLAPGLKETGISGSLVVESVLNYWHCSPWVGFLVLDKLVVSEVIEPVDVVKHILIHQDLLLSASGYDRLKKHASITKQEISLLSEGTEWEQWWSQRLRKVFA